MIGLWIALALAAAASGPAKDGRMPYTIVGYTWSDVRPELDNLVSFGTRRLTMDNLNDPAGMKAVTDKMPAGHRVLFLWDVENDIADHPDDRCRDAGGNLTEFQGVWWEHGAERVRQRLDDFFRRYKQIGGKLDVLVMDYEGGLSNWHLGDDLKRWKAIETDLRFPEIAKRLGFSDLSTVGEWWKQQGDARRNYLRWNAMMNERVAASLNRAVYAPARKYYPSIRFSNYGHFHYSAALGVPDSNGHRYYLFGRGAHVGTHQSSELYAWLGQIENNPPDGVPSYPHTPFNSFRHALNEMRCMAGSSDVPIYPWLAYRGFSEGYVGVTKNDLYQELVFHAGLCGADAFLFWNPRPWAANQDPKNFTSDEQDKLFSDCLKQLDRLIGDPRRKTLTKTLVSWNADYALSGMIAKGRAVWRFTPRLEGGARRESVLVSESPATFRAGDRRIAIAGGKVYHPDGELSQQGYWVIAPLRKGGGYVRETTVGGNHTAGSPDGR